MVLNSAHNFFLFVSQLISDAGYQAEIGSMSSACNQIEVFARILKTSLTNYISQRNENESIIKEIAVSHLFISILMCSFTVSCAVINP